MDVHLGIAALSRAVEVSRLRSQINDNFANLESQADAVRFEFEFHRRREEDVAEFERI